MPVVRQARVYVKQGCTSGKSVRQARVYIRQECTSGKSVLQARVYVRQECTSGKSVRQARVYFRQECTSGKSVRQARVYVRQECTSGKSVLQARVYFRQECTSGKSVRQARALPLAYLMLAAPTLISSDVLSVVNSVCSCRHWHTLGLISTNEHGHKEFRKATPCKFLANQLICVTLTAATHTPRYPPF